MLLEQATRLQASGEFEQAAVLAGKVLKQAPKDPVALQLLIRSQAGMGDYAAARASIERALRIRPADLELLADLARTWLNQGRMPEALRAADRVLRLAPANTSLIGLKAHIQAFSGDAEGAWETLRTAVDSGACDPGLANPFALIARRVGEAERAIAMVRGCLAEPALPGALRAELCFRLGDLLDGAGDWDAAFGAYEEGNRIRRASIKYDAAETRGAIEELIAAWRPGLSLPAATVRTDRPIFIVGMPRSGTSLVEQILGTHPSVFSAGEIDDIQNLAHAWQGTARGQIPVFRRLADLSVSKLDAAAKAYLERLRRLDARAARITDKLPVNSVQLGLISRLFPASRAIHCTRDPIDTCLSCYFQNFSGPIPYAYDLRELGAFFVVHRRLMDHWREVLDFQRLEVPYEELVKDQENMSRRLVEFAGLPWDDRCLRFHESGRTVLTSSNAQVRRPMYASSVGRWRRYERHLGPLIDALAR